MNFSIEGFLLLCSLSILLEINVGTVSGFAFFVVKDHPQTHHQHDQRRCEHNKFKSGHVTNKQSNFILTATASSSSSSSSEGRRKLGYSKEDKRIMRNQSRTRSSQKSPNLSVSSQNQPQQKEPYSSINTSGIRLNKVLKATHSRRQADKLIAEGRLRVNGLPVESKGGFFVIPYKDEIMLDGKIIHGWEDMNPAVEGGNNEVQGSSTSASSFTKNIEKSLKQFDYIKYWKPTGVICTTDRTIRNNIIHAFTKYSSSSSYKPKHRIYPVGRLDKETSGLIILTSDGRLPNAVLRGDTKQPKRYKVRVDKILNERDVQKLRDGVVITTVAQRDGKKADPLTQRTKRCQVKFPLSGGEADIPSLAYNDKKKSRRNDLSYWFEIILMEGRNRQIRKMCGALGYTVLELQRVEFMGIHLEERNNNNGLNGPGDWALLDEREMDLITSALQNNI